MSAPGSNPAVAGEIKSKATTALIASIVGFVCCPLIQIWVLMSVSSAQAPLSKCCR